jgi:hypothetical protein
MCFNKACDRNRRSIPRARIEGAFVALLERMTPTTALLDMSRAMFSDAWEQRSAQAHAIRKTYLGELAKVDQQIDGLLDRIVDASPTVASAYEKRIDALEREKLVLAEKSRDAGKPRGSFEENFELAFSFIGNPAKLWNTGQLAHRRLVLQLTFADQLQWNPDNSFQTPKTTMPFSLLGGVNRPFDGMAEREGFEPVFRLSHRPALINAASRIQV